MAGLAFHSEEVTGTSKKGRDRHIGGNEEKEKGSECSVQEKTFNYFFRAPDQGFRPFYVMAI